MGMKLTRRQEGLLNSWEGTPARIAYDEAGIREHLLMLDRVCYIVVGKQDIGSTMDGQIFASRRNGTALAVVSLPAQPEFLGDQAFLETYGLRYAYMAGSMANGISSEAMVISLGKAGMLGAFGAGGLLPDRLEEAILRIQNNLPGGPYAFNLIHSPVEPALERGAVDLYIKHGVRVVEASAYIKLTPHVIRYRVAGLVQGQDGRIHIRNRIIAKLSRREVARQFMEPAPATILHQLVEQGLITEEQGRLAMRVPMADDVTVEADSGGHTDNRPLVCLLPSIIDLRDELQAQYQFETPVRVGAAGGIGTPISALGAFMMGAAYIVTGSINHSCVEAGTSQHVKELLSQAAMTDVMMAPAADMFEMGVKLQVLKRGTMFALRARKLYEFYEMYDSLDDIPLPEQVKLEQQIFKRTLDSVWEECISFFNKRDPSQIEKAMDNPKRKMALVFRWYLGLATRWGIKGEKGREVDYQIWCGPSMGAFNDWTRGTYLEKPGNRKVAEVGYHIMRGAAYQYRIQNLRVQGIQIPVSIAQYKPEVLV
jgi:trans-AT polyketide synthase/acyltransferase/oxidoreductase domain-containing protein